MSERALLVVALLAGGCHTTARCRSGTVFVDVLGAAGADQLSVAVSTGGRLLTGEQPYAGQSGIEIDFPGGYPAGQAIEITITAQKGGSDVASGSLSSTLSSGCARLTMTLVSLVGDDLGGDDLGAVDPDADLSVGGGDLAGPRDLANADLQVVPATWTQVTVSGSQPSAAHSVKWVYDSFRDQVVLFSNGQTWLWHGNTSSWTQATPANSPSSRSGYGMTYDSDRHVTVLFGGQNSTSLDEVWEWDGTNWANKTPGTRPWDVQATAIAFHAARHRTIMWGGYSQSHNSAYDVTWEWDGATWTKPSTTLSPSADAGHSLAYDSARQMVVLAGSTAQGSATWEFDVNGQWNKRTPATPPGSHRGIGLAYDAARGVTVLFGGGASSNDLDDTWEWNGTDWAHTGTTGPSARRALAMTYDSLRGKIWLFGGGSGHSPTNRHNDVWSWQ